MCLGTMTIDSSGPRFPYAAVVEAFLCAAIWFSRRISNKGAPKRVSYPFIRILRVKENWGWGRSRGLDCGSTEGEHQPPTRICFTQHDGLNLSKPLNDYH